MNFYTNVRVYGNKVLYRGIHGNDRLTKKFDYKPVLFVPSKTQSAEYKDIHGNPYGAVNFDSIKEAKEFLKQYSDVENMKIHGMTRFEYTFIRDHFKKTINWDFSKVRIARIDIEVASENGFPEPERADEMLTAITIKIGDTYHVFGYPDFKVSNKKMIYYRCSDETDMIRKFMDLWTSDYPDVVTGWNIQYFDMPYLYNRFKRLFGEEFANKLSPWRVIHSKSHTYGTKVVTTLDIWGISCLDSIDLYQRYSPDGLKQDSYTLNNIALVELDEQKLDYSEYGDLNKLYKNNPIKHLEYNIHDVDLDERIEKKYGLLNLALTLAYMNKVNHDDVFTQVRMWTVIVDNFLREKNIVLNHKTSFSKEEYTGGFVLDPMRGMHHWIASVDATSLYPSMIMQYNISPDTIVDASEYTENMRKLTGQNVNVDTMLDQSIDTSLLKVENVALTPNNQLFRRDKQGFLAEIIEKMFNSRTEYKDKQIEFEKQSEKSGDKSEKKRFKEEAERFKSLQTSVKLCLNSCYGALGSEYFILYDTRLAEAVTTSGRLAIQWIGKSINEFLAGITGVDKNYLIAQDTDSAYITMDELIKKILPGESDVHKIINFMDAVCKEPLANTLIRSSEELKEYTNAFQQKLHMKREILADRGVWTNKKRYFLNVWDSEGVRYKEPKVKITGLEAIKSNTPVHCRKKIKDLCKVILNKSEPDVWKFIKEYREEFDNLDLSVIASPSGLNGLNTYKDDQKIFGYKCPMHVRAALVYNHNIEKMGLSKRYDFIKDGTKIKYIMLKEPNPLGSSVIAWENEIPKEFELEKYVDYQAQFEKAFLKPVELILAAIGWSSVRRNSLLNYT